MGTADRLIKFFIFLRSYNYHTKSEILHNKNMRQQVNQKKDKKVVLAGTVYHIKKYDNFFA